jgi:hypothetical protein
MKPLKSIYSITALLVAAAAPFSQVIAKDVAPPIPVSINPVTVMLTNATPANLSVELCVSTTSDCMGTAGDDYPMIKSTLNMAPNDNEEHSYSMSAFKGATSTSDVFVSVFVNGVLNSDCITGLVTYGDIFKHSSGFSAAVKIKPLTHGDMPYTCEIKQNFKSS